jgi:hypothetical protein
VKHFCRAVLGGVLCAAAPMRAQGAPPANEAQKRNDCRLADQVVRTGHPAPHREWAYTMLLGCEETEPAAIAAMWTGARHPVGDEFQFLIRATRRVRDRRVYSALRSVGESDANDLDTRLHALGLLIVYVKPIALILHPSDLRSPPDAPSPLGRIVTHTDVVLGSEPVGDVREELRAYYLELKESDPDAVIRNAARILLRHIR